VNISAAKVKTVEQFDGQRGSLNVTRGVEHCHECSSPKTSFISL